MANRGNNTIILFTAFQLMVWSVFISITSGFNPRIGRDEVEEKECIGTSSFFSSSVSPALWYDVLRIRYQGCTYVLGNLEITHLQDPAITYDLSFLRHIRYVSGYVLIAFVDASSMPLPNLEIIRGNDTLSFQGEEYSLMVALTSIELKGSPAKGLRTLMMPKLQEISNGKVMFANNPRLGYVDSIDWSPILKGRPDSVDYGEEPYNVSASNQTDTDLCNGRGMWGPDESLCQAVMPSPICDDQCGTLCFGTGPEDCCHDTCAIGCSGPTAGNCTRCRDFHYEGNCVSYCPELTYQLQQECVKYTPRNLH